MESRLEQHEIRALLNQIQQGDLKYVLDADQQITDSGTTNDRYTIGRKMRYTSWLQQKGTTNRLLRSIPERIRLLLPDVRLAQDDFFISSPSQTKEAILAKMMRNLNPHLSESACHKILSLYTLGLDREERLMRSTVLHIMETQNAATIHEVEWGPLIRPHTIYGGVVRDWQYRCLTGLQGKNWGEGNRGYAVIDKRDHQIFRILVPQRDTRTAYYTQS